jgi:hypothetical protein
MSHSVWEVFLALFRGGEETEAESDDGEDGGGFVPSPLDLSVRIGHGGSDDERVRELADISEQAREIEEKRRGH